MSNKDLQKLMKHADTLEWKQISECPIVPFEESKKTPNPYVLLCHLEDGQFGVPTVASYEYTDKGKGRFMHRDYYGVVNVTYYTHWMPIPDGNAGAVILELVTGLEYNEEAELQFIEQLNLLPISLQSNANQDYIQMGSEIYNLAVKVLSQQALAKAAALVGGKGDE